MHNVDSVGQIRQLHIAASVAASSGGEGLAALRFAEAVAHAGCEVTLLSKDSPSQIATTSTENSHIHMQSIPNHRNPLIALSIQYRFILQFCRKQEINLIHIHGMWTPFLAVAALAARKAGIPFVISPHGCLEPWALTFKRLKKRLAMIVYQGPILRSAALFFATADQELKSIRSLGLMQPVAVIPNGVEVGTQARHFNPNEALNTILFLSRLHPKKGLADLVEAWAKVRQPGWKIVIAGGDEGGYRAQVENLIAARGLTSEFEFLGHVEGARKQACFDMASIFVLPTYSENFGIAIAEALANELPVITTTGAPWSDLISYRCGWWVEPGVEGISSALLDAMALPPQQRTEMGVRGRNLVLKKYSWERIGQAGLEAGQWLLDRSRPLPKTIDTSNLVNHPMS